MPFRHFIIPFLALLLPLRPVFAQAKDVASTLTIEQLVEQATAQNPELQFYTTEIAAVKGERRAAAAWSNPELSGEVGRKRVKSEGLASEGMAWSVSLAQSFEWPGRVSLKKAIAERQIRLAELGLDQFSASLRAKVRQYAYELFTAQRREAAAMEVSARAEELIATLVQREPAGITPLLETRVIEASVIRLRAEATKARRAAEKALYNLNLLRGRPMQTPITISDVDLTFAEIPSTEELIRRAATRNFELKQREVELAQQGFKVALSKNEAWPTVTIGPNISREESNETETTVTMGVSLPLPLWDRNTGNIDAAKARQMQAATSLAVAQRDVEKQIREHATDYRLLAKEIGHLTPNVTEQLREAATLASRHYRLGAVPVSTYLEMQEAYLEALESIFETQAEALEARAELELLTGTKLP